MTLKPKENGDIRCGCNSLIAKLVGNQVEIKCRRCKKIVKLPVQK